MKLSGVLLDYVLYHNERQNWSQSNFYWFLGVNCVATWQNLFYIFRIKLNFHPENLQKYQYYSIFLKFRKSVDDFRHLTSLYRSFLAWMVVSLKIYFSKSPISLRKSVFKFRSWFKQCWALKFCMRSYFKYTDRFRGRPDRVVWKVNINPFQSSIFRRWLSLEPLIHA